jgi:hypothetical protein
VTSPIVFELIVAFQLADPQLSEHWARRFDLLEHSDFTARVQAGTGSLSLDRGENSLIRPHGGSAGDRSG